MSGYYPDSESPDGNERGYNHVSGSKTIFLDVEKGNMSAIDFARIHSTVRMTTYSTFNSTTEAPRYRIMIPLSKWVDAIT